MSGGSKNADGVVTSAFGPRGGRFHDGIDIAAPVGTAIYAAAGGEVVFHGKLSGYGNVLVLRHGSGFSTVYAHNDRHYVRAGQRVRRGDRIAGVGRSGRVTGPNLHFEIRYDNEARDPLVFLPEQRVAGLESDDGRLASRLARSDRSGDT